ncbi:hypothetical protein SALBM311S_09977 [Streptomyces alboniger]
MRRCPPSNPTARRPASGWPAPGRPAGAGPGNRARSAPRRALPPAVRSQRGGGGVTRVEGLAPRTRVTYRHRRAGLLGDRAVAVLWVATPRCRGSRRLGGGRKTLAKDAGVDPVRPVRATGQGQEASRQFALPKVSAGPTRAPSRSGSGIQARPRVRGARCRAEPVQAQVVPRTVALDVRGGGGPGQVASCRSAWPEPAAVPTRQVRGRDATRPALEDARPQPRGLPARPRTRTSPVRRHRPSERWRRTARADVVADVGLLDARDPAAGRRPRWRPSPAWWYVLPRRGTSAAGRSRRSRTRCRPRRRRAGARPNAWCRRRQSGRPGDLEAGGGRDGVDGEPGRPHGHVRREGSSASTTYVAPAATMPVCSWTVMPNRSKASRRWSRAPGESRAPSSPRAASATGERPGGGPAISVAVSMPSGPRRRPPRCRLRPDRPGVRAAAAPTAVRRRRRAQPPRTPWSATRLPSVYSSVCVPDLALTVLAVAVVRVHWSHARSCAPRSTAPRRVRQAQGGS